jgi:hypothetical protein
MQIRTLVFIGIVCIIVSMALYFYLNMDTLFDNLKTVQKRILHEKETKQTLVEIDAKSKEKLDKAAAKAEVPVPAPSAPSTKSIISSDVEDLNKELEKLKRDLEKHSRFDGGHHSHNQSSTDKKPVDKPAPDFKKNEEAFLVKSNIFNKDESNKVCKALFNSRAATREELNADYNNGANWCNYGWTTDGAAYYPLQNNSDTPACVGSKGLNGGALDGAPKLGITCYGVKPTEKEYTSLETIYRDSSIAEADITMLEKYRQMMSSGKIKVAPFNDKVWSRYSFKDDRLNIGNNTIITQKKDTSKDPNSIKTEKVQVQGIVNVTPV